MFMTFYLYPVGDRFGMSNLAIGGDGGPYIAGEVRGDTIADVLAGYGEAYGEVMDREFRRFPSEGIPASSMRAVDPATDAPEATEIPPRPVPRKLVDGGHTYG